MAKRYRKKNGLFLADDSLVLPGSPPQPWYAGVLSQWRGMSRRRCCCPDESSSSESSESPSSSSDEPPGCCASGFGPDEWQVDIDGIAGNGLGCDSACVANNDSYVVSRVSTSATTCQWGYLGASVNCVGVQITVIVTNNPATSTYSVSVQVWYKPAELIQGLTGTVWNYDSPVVCSDFDETNSVPDTTSGRCIMTSGHIRLVAL